CGRAGLKEGPVMRLTRHLNATLLAACCLALATAAPANAQNVVGGEGFGLRAGVVGFATIDESPHVVLPSTGGEAQGSLLSVGVPGLASPRTLTAETSGTIALASASSTPESGIEQLSRLGGLITADLLVARSTCTGNGASASCNA